VDPLKVKDIITLPLPNNLTQLQSLQGKEKFLHRFTCNYAKITKGFMILLQKYAPFIWDATAQRSFDDLKHALMNTPMLHPPQLCKILHPLFGFLCFHYCHGFSTRGR